MRYLSVFSGIEAATVAWSPLGWTPIGFAEIAKFPSAVLASHYPQIMNLGDVRRYRSWPDAAFDVLVGGSPCQSFSIGGLRKGLSDDRGRLAFSYFAIAQRYLPSWLVFENVPGLLSAHDGTDFASLTSVMAELGYGYAWCVLDAQYVRVDGFCGAVPQRRRRLFLVGYLGDWRAPAAVLFESDCLSGRDPPRREAGPQASRRVVSSLVASGRGVSRTGESRGQDPLVAFGGNNSRGQIEVSTALNGHAGGWRRIDFESETFVTVAQTLTANWQRSNGASAGNNGDLINPVVTDLRVRRLTVRECERLMGLPDDYTLIPYRKRLAADGPRYKALGDAMAVNVMRWIGRRIQHVEALLAGRSIA